MSSFLPVLFSAARAFSRDQEENTMKEAFLAALTIVLLYWPNTAAASCSTFGGRAAVVQANALGIGSVVLSDTGNLDSTGGVKTASLLGASVDGLVAVNVMHAAAIAKEDYSQSEASVANLNLTVAGNIISADFLVPRAIAYCGRSGAEVSASSEIDGLVVNGQTIPVTGSPNQTLSLPGSVMIILNEQNSSVQDQDGSITVNALHVTVPGGVDAVIASSFAAVSGSPLPIRPRLGIVGGGGGEGPCDFVTGGGWISNIPSGGKGTFGVGGGMRHGESWGHLEYHDHGTGMNVHGTGVTAYTVGSAGPTSRHIEGTAEVDHQSGFTYMIDVADNGEPGRNDTFDIQLSNGYMAGGLLSGGNIKLHTNPASCK
jgi:hypothetical protein